MANQAISWSISPTVGDISTGGLYIAPSTLVTDQTVTVTATSLADTTKSATATITLMPPVAVSVTPVNTTTLGPNQTQQFTANIQNAPGPLFLPSSPAVATVGYGNYRTGANLAEAVLTPANVASSLSRLGNFSVDGYIYAQPLFVGQVTLPDGSTHDLLIVATMNNSVYAFDANSPGQSALWSTNLSPTNANTLTAISPTGAGILSTPVIDLANNLVYVVYETPTPTYVLAKLDLLTGQSLGSVTITGQVPGIGDASYADTVSGPNLIFYPKYELQRAGLALANGRIYIAFASWGDIRPQHGWIFSYDATDLSQKGVACLSPTEWGATVWQSGGAPAVDDNGNLYVVTGNGAGTFEKSEAFVKLDQNLNVLADFQLALWMALSADDQDFSGRPMIVPGQSLILAGAKDHNLYGLDLGFVGPLQIVPEAGEKAGIFNGAVFNGDVYTADGPIFSHPISGTGVGNQGKTTVNVYAQSVALSGSCNGTSNCLLWATTLPNADGVVAGTLRAFDANTLTELYNSDTAPNGADTLGTQSKFVAPLVINGRVYVPNQNNSVQVYGVPLAISRLPASQPITGTSVTWMITPNIGSISPSGLYTAPSTISSSQTVTVMAVSQADWTKSASTTIMLMAPPAITSQPQSKTVSGGATATFTVIATGANLTYQWSSAAAGSSFFSPINGATASSYTAGPMTQSMSGTQYECTVSNGLGTTTSTIATFSMLAQGTGYVMSAALGTLRNNFSGWVGMSISVGNSPIAVAALGRMFATSNASSHIVKIVTTNGQNVSGASVSVSMSGGTVGNFVYANLPAPVTLNANTTYYVVSQETQGGDLWYDNNTTIQTTNVASETTSVYSNDGSTYIFSGGTDQSYVPVDFRYTVSISQPVITLQPQSQTVSAGMSATFSVTATGGNLTYQWSSAPSGSSSFMPITGATASTYTASGITVAQSGIQYMCVVTNTAGQASSSAATLTVVASPPPTANYVTSTSLGALRNNFSGWVGMSISVGNSPLTVTPLGRMFAPGNTGAGAHNVKIVNAATGCHCLDYFNRSSHGQCGAQTATNEA